jgi:hypothetical protein
MPTNNSCNYAPVQHNVITGGANGSISGVAPGANLNVLTSNGTDWTSAAPPAGNLLISATVTLTSAQIKAIHGTPIQIIAAPGAGKGLVLVSAVAKFNYGGTNAFTAAASQTIGLYYNNSTTQLLSGNSFITNAMIVSTANAFSTVTSITNGNVQGAAAGVLDNVNIAAFNSVATEITGNAAGNNTIDIILAYWIVTF